MSEVGDERAEYSAEDKEIAQNEAIRLIKESADINLSCGVLLAARQLYAMAKIALSRQLIEEGAHEVTEELLVQAMNAKSTAPFHDQDLLHKISTLVLLFMEKEIERGVQQQKDTEKEEFEASEKRRKANDIPIGFSWTADGITQLSRDKSLMLLGSRKSLKVLAGQAFNAAQSRPETGETPRVVVAHLVDHLADSSELSSNKKGRSYVKIGANQTGGSCNSIKAFDQLMASWRRLTYKNRIDLLIIEDVSQLYTAGITGRSSARNAESAHKVIHKWAKAAGCAVLACFPVDCGSDERLSVEAELGDVNKHADLYWVDVLPSESKGKARIKTGDSNLSLEVEAILVT